jgi:recombinational DNA repair protein RecR
MAKNSIIPLNELIAQFERLPGIGKKRLKGLVIIFWNNHPKELKNLPKRL